MIVHKYIISIGEVLAVCSLLVIDLFSLGTVTAFSFSLSPTNCSHLCTCENRDVEMVMAYYRHQHMGYMGDKIRNEFAYEPSSDYMAFLGVFGSVMRSMVDVTCKISDGRPHTLSSLLNGVEKIMHTALKVQCHSNEQLIWDVPSWEVSFNVFNSHDCILSPVDPTRGLVLPMNLWIFDVQSGGAGLLNMLDIKFLMNTVAFCVSDSQIRRTPPQWYGWYLLSVSLVTLQYAGLETFDCFMLFANRVNTLNLENNDFVRFPECLLRSSEIKLKYLSLAHNLISDLTPMYDSQTDNEIPDVNIINMSHNDVRDLKQMRPMPTLRVIDFSHNFIKEISDDVFAHLKHLTHLDLSHNRIHTIGFSSFRQNTALMKLDLSNNVLQTVLPEQLPLTKRFLNVDIRNNDLHHPPLQECSRIKFPVSKARFLSSGNHFYCDCNMLDFEFCLDYLHATEVNISFPENMYEDLSDLICSGPKEVAGVAIESLRFSSQCIVSNDCPFSCNCVLKNTNELLVNCSHRRLLEMPDSIPYFLNTTVLLHLDHNPMQMLSYRSYLGYLTELHMDNCLISSVTPSAIAALQNVQVLTLHNNLLQKLPATTRNITLNQANNVTLHNNRWYCSCDSLWLPRWISKHRAVLWAPGNIMCNYLRKPVEDFSEVDINCNTSKSYMEVVLGVCLALASLVSTLVLVIYYQTEINVLVYSKLGVRLGSTLVYGDANSPYDAFVSYSQDNYKWVVDMLVPQLENRPHRYRLCMHYRDFPAEESIVDNIPWAIHLSRCSILVLSKSFLEKEWCIMELRATFQRLLLASNKLIVLLTENLQLEDVTPDLRAYMNTHEYLRVGESNFWDKLNMMLPPPKAPSDPTVAGQAGGDNWQMPDQPQDSSAAFEGKLSELGH